MGSWSPAVPLLPPQISQTNKKDKTQIMARRTQDPISRFLNDYSSLDTSQRAQVSAAIRGFEYSGATAGVKRTSPVTPRTTPRSAAGVITPSPTVSTGN